jgi:zinc D-Ala-D-Ala carboxypeptidase
VKLSENHALAPNAHKRFCHYGVSMQSRGAVSPPGALGIPPLMAVAIASVAVSFVVFLAMVAGAACGSDDPPPGGSDVGFVTPTDTATNTSTATSTTAPENTATATAPATNTPGATTAAPTPTRSSGGGSNTPGPAVTTLPCGNILAPVNKQNRLPENCAPAVATVPEEATDGTYQSLRSDALNAILEMFDAAAKEDVELVVVSSYRSYQTQVQTYQYWVDTLGREQADRTSARPGHSEHQLGTTADVSAEVVGFDLTESFGDTKEGRWLADNSWRYGFVISYPAGKESVTGYAYEPWHIRFIGKGEAASVHNSGRTLHEYLLGR